MVLSSRTITAGRRNPNNVSHAMVAEALRTSEWHGLQAATKLRKLVEAEDELVEQAGQGSNSADERVGAMVAFHLASFDPTDYSRLRNKPGMLSRLAKLARQGCYYMGKKLYRPPVEKKKKALSLRAASVWENTDGALSGLIHMLRHSADGLARDGQDPRHRDLRVLRVDRFTVIRVAPTGDPEPAGRELFVQHIRHHNRQLMPPD